MGANEKHEATYHGHTPSLEEIRRHWGLAVDTHRRDMRLAEFDRMINKVRAEAWDTCARSIVYEDGTPVEIMSLTNPYK